MIRSSFHVKHILDRKSEFQDGEKTTLDGFQLKSVILQALQTLHGQVGSGLFADVTN